MPKPSNPKTEQVLLHGTTLSRAQAIVTAGKFSPTESLYVVFQANRDLAEIFACRKARREHDLPAVVRIVIDAVDFENVRRRGDAKLVPFDEGDDPNLRSRNQWVIMTGGVQFLNPRLNSLDSQLVVMR